MEQETWSTAYGLGISGIMGTPLLGLGMSGMIGTPLFGLGMSGIIGTPLFGLGISGMMGTPLRCPSAYEMAMFVAATAATVRTSDLNLLAFRDIKSSNG